MIRTIGGICILMLLMPMPVQSMQEPEQGVLISCEECVVLYPEKYAEQPEDCPVCGGKKEHFQLARMMEKALIAAQGRDVELKIEKFMIGTVIRRAATSISLEALQEMRDLYLNKLRFHLVYDYFELEPIKEAITVLDKAIQKNKHSQGADTQEPLLVRIKQEYVHPSGDAYLFLKGAAESLTVFIENVSSDFILLRSVRVVGQLPDTDRWYGVQYGTTTYYSQEDAWEYDEMDQMLSDPVFAKGVIPPGGSLEVVRWGIVRQASIPIKIAYHRLLPSEASAHFYFSGDDKAGFSLKRTFARCKDSKALLNTEHEINYREVIAPEIDKFSLLIQEVTCSVSITEFGFTLAQACAAIKGDVLDYVFWEDENVWGLKTSSRTYLVAPSVVEELPAIDLLSFIIIESSDKSVPVIFPLAGYEVFKPQQPTVNGPGYFNPGITKIPKHDLSALFEYVREAGDTISVLHYDANGLGVGRYLLIGAFDEMERRRFIDANNDE